MELLAFYSCLLPVILWFIAVRLWQKFVELTADPTSELPLPPGGAGLPFIGETFELAYKGFRFFNDRRKEYGRIYRTHIMGKPTIRFYGSENIKRVLSRENVNVTMRWPASVKMLMGSNALMASTGEIHHIRRKSISQAFTVEAVKDYLPVIQSTVRAHLAKWLSKGTILGEEESRYLSVDLAMRGLLGYQLTDRDVLHITNAMKDIENGFFSLPLNIPSSPLNKGLKARKIVMSYINQAVIMHSKQRTEDMTQVSCALTHILKTMDEDKMSVDELSDCCMEMLFSSVEGVSSAVCTMLLELAKHGQAIETAAQELYHLELIETQRDGDITESKMAELSYVRRIVKEVLRLIPPVGGGYRHVLKTFELDGYQIPKGWTILYSIRDQHDRGTDNSKKFDPDRWLPHRDVTKVDDHLYIPFGGSGPRCCVGERFATVCLEVLAIEVIRGCQWRLLEPNPVMKYFPVPYPSEGLPLRFNEAPPFRQRRVTL